MISIPSTLRRLPRALEPLLHLALDLRWTWSHAADALWSQVDPRIWTETKNPWVLLEHASTERFDRLLEDSAFLAELQRLDTDRKKHCEGAGCYSEQFARQGIRHIAYFSMEFALGPGLPLYAGGLGILAGDHLKAASDLGLPLVGVGILFQEGYFRQILDESGRQLAAYPHNDPRSLPLQPVLAADGRWLHVDLELPGRILSLRLWQGQAGRVKLYLLDANSPLNRPRDRGITAKLYDSNLEIRLMQEIVLGIGGYRALELLGIEVDVLHLNEGHAALAVLGRIRSLQKRLNLSFTEALWAARAGTVFTTHTPIEAGFDRFPPSLLYQHFANSSKFLADLGVAPSKLLALGRQNPADAEEPFNMAYFALRCSLKTNGVSRLHGEVSREIFQPLFPRWPRAEIPVSHITNGVHFPSWDSPWADTLWTEACGKDRWMGSPVGLCERMQDITDEQIWRARMQERRDLIDHVRARRVRDIAERSPDPETLETARRVLDPNVLTVGFARRFAAYKRPTLLLRQPERLIRLLERTERPIQLVVAGKAHPDDKTGKDMVQAWARFVELPAIRHRAVFLEDYDMGLAREMVQGVDLWINTPLRPWEACGTSGMKVLVNGGLNLSVLDGWWLEAWEERFGWAVDGGKDLRRPRHDDDDAAELFRLLESEIVPMFYDRDGRGVPCAWIQRVRACLAHLAPQFSTNRMLGEYVESMYLPAARAFSKRTANQAQLARELARLESDCERHCREIRFGKLEHVRNGGHTRFSVEVYLGELDPEAVRVELFAEAEKDSSPPVRIVMSPARALEGSLHGYVFEAVADGSRPPTDFTPRILAFHPEAVVPTELALILWQR